MEEFHWTKKWEKKNADFHKWNFDLSKGPIHISWFNGAETNVCYNCLDRHVEAGEGDRVCFYWEGNDPGQERTVTYQEMLDLVCQIGNYLRSQGAGPDDEVAIYMPMIPELPATMLACSRIGAIFSVVFAGFSAESLGGRLTSPVPKVLVTCSAVRRGAKPIELKKIVDEALEIVEQSVATQAVDPSASTPHMHQAYSNRRLAEGLSSAALGGEDGSGRKGVPHVLVFDHTQASGLGRDKFQAGWVEGRDVWWQDVIPSQPTTCEVTWRAAEDTLFKLYTSGSTGQPKGVLHTTAGYMAGIALTYKYVFDHRPTDVFWCTADCGWITGHSYVSFGPMLNGATQILFEGIPTYPDAGRWWELVDKYQCTVFYTAPTAIRALMAQGDQWVKKYKRSSVRILGTVGEPINPEAWWWYYDVVGEKRADIVVGEKRADIVDTWWQTETGMHMITPLPGCTPLKAGAASLPFFGVEPALLDQAGNEIEGPGQGYLVIKRPWPAMMRTVAGDHARFEQTYFSQYKGYYFTGDGARRDEDGYYWITGRVDDVINVSGHRIGTAEVESALVGHHLCAEAAVVPLDHPIKGTAIYAYVTLMEGLGHPPDDPEAVRKELVKAVRKAIGPIATPDVIHWAPALPKTRSGKIMRRVLRKIASGHESKLGDISTLADPGVVKALIELRGK
ncbi:Acetyl-coenzyme A synthetase isoform A [Chlorella sorokiniana]|uniref:acetate--CoA ligase n=1 Tax=Chlorella sorokiniana TaxID=3076 RepID=A0A2P6TCL1_CHLSO|nr:Acetyl-coenzyme A synthetase isoform A [Chlorella sorokiniana]|eukprot:PRW20362.1 Acetyl-coenzyme A synthetase isoform A [Chlorella sorokiniana]